MPCYMLWFLFIISYFSTLPLSLSATEPRFSNCFKRFDCGKITNLGYPFWGNGREAYCGHPSFELKCRSGSVEIGIGTENYTVMDITTEQQTLRLQYPRLTLASDRVCRGENRNISLSSDNVFHVLSRNLTVAYGCTPNPQAANTSSNQCGRKNIVWLQLTNSTPSTSFSKCNATIISVQDLKTNLFYNGVVVRYSLNATSCVSCERSGGQCGYSQGKPTCFCSDGEDQLLCATREKGTIAKKIGIGLGSGVLAIFLATILCLCCKKVRISLTPKISWKRKKKDQRLVENFLKNCGSMAPKRYSYADIKKITSSFKDKIGQGGYGEVYKGKLIDGCPVAVKLMNKAKGNGEDFINEVASISRTSHVNIVSLLGFCFDESKRALIYEFMANGSLEKFIYDHNTSETQSHLGWDVLYKIAVGVARGLEYLHRGCNTLILHLDIKPHNILLDQDFNPKISDFGLAKLYARDESIASMLNGRGTPGYTAPEMINRNFGRVSHKSDVYSYGMMVLEMVGKRRNVDIGADHSSEIYFPQWIYKRLLVDEDLGLCGALSEEDEEITKKMILVALWCIQSNPMDRPEMSRVEEMLEGKSDLLPIPPKPYLCSPPRSTPAVL